MTTCACNYVLSYVLIINITSHIIYAHVLVHYNIIIILAVHVVYVQLYLLAKIAQLE